MKKAVFLVLGIVVILSLGISGYLLISKSEAERIEEIWQEAQTGDAGAQYSLGQAYVQGNSDAGLEPDAGQAEQWLQKAAVQRHHDAQCALGVFYQSAGDDVGAYAWLSIASSGTNDLASQLRDASTKRMTEVQLTEARQMIGRLKSGFK